MIRFRKPSRILKPRPKRSNWLKNTLGSLFHKHFSSVSNKARSSTSTFFWPNNKKSKALSLLTKLRVQGRVLKKSSMMLRIKAWESSLIMSLEMCPVLGANISLKLCIQTRKRSLLARWLLYFLSDNNLSQLILAMKWTILWPKESRIKTKMNWRSQKKWDQVLALTLEKLNLDFLNSWWVNLRSRAKESKSESTNAHEFINLLFKESSFISKTVFV